MNSKKFFELTIDCAFALKWHYHSFGMQMPGKSYSPPSNYRYGFNGKEKDNDIKNIDGSSLDFGARIYDPRLGRFLSTDPLFKNSPDWSPYVFAEDNPIILIDVDGKYPGEKHYNKLERYKSKHATELKNLNPQEIEDRFSNAQMTILGKYGKMNKDTKWYREWLAISGEHSLSTGYPLETNKTVPINSPIGGESNTSSGEVPFNNGTVKMYINESGGGDSGLPPDPIDVTLVITDGDGNTLVNKTYKNITKQGYINDDIPFRKKTTDVDVTVTATYSVSGATVTGYAWGTTFSPDKKALDPIEGKPDAKPKYNITKKKK